MLKLKEIVLMLCLILSGAFCHASGVAGTENGKEVGTPKIVIIKAQHGGIDKSGSIEASIDGYTLTVAFTENLGQVSIEIATTTGVTVDCMSMLTPDGFQFFIPNTGDYIVTFTLPNGDEYYGEFTVTE